MKIVVFAPYGSLSEESGIIYLLANYLKPIFGEVVQLQCNGVFSMCDRDAEQSWKRSIWTCFRCLSDQKKLRQWSMLDAQDLSTHILPEDIERTKRWVHALDVSELKGASFDGADIFSLCTGSFWNRFGVSEPDLNNKNHEQVLRRFLLAASRAWIASERFHQTAAANMTFVAGGWDFITRAYTRQAKAGGVGVVLFKRDLSARAIQVIHPTNGKILSCECVIEGITNMRSDSKTWPYELVEIIEQILTFLEISDGQLMLPIAK